MSEKFSHQAFEKHSIFDLRNDQMNWSSYRADFDILVGNISESIRSIFPRLMLNNYSFSSLFHIHLLEYFSSYPTSILIKCYNSSAQLFSHIYYSSYGISPSGNNKIDTDCILQCDYLGFTLLAQHSC